MRTFGLAALVVLLGCSEGNSITCGAGTVLVGSACEPADAGTVVVTCGAGTVLVGTTCEPVDASVADASAVTCGPGTVEQNGVCVPVDAGVDCSAPIACPPPGAGKIAVCGRAFDLEDSSFIGSSLAATLYDSVAFLSDPEGATKLATVTPDACGRFAFLAIPTPSSGGVAVAIDDAPTATDDRALSAILRPISNGLTIENVNAWSLRHTTDTAWSTSAGLGTTFAAGGVWVGIYVDASASAAFPFVGSPTAGVTATRGGTTAAADDFYFTDTNPLSRTTVGTPSTTGANGTALLQNGSLTQYGGQGAEPNGCQWSSALAAAPAGVVLVQEDVAHCP